MVDLLMEGSVGRLGRLVEASAVEVVKPPVVEAAEPSILHPAEAQVGPAMRAMEPQKSGSSSLI
jgi:hypothetical protein